MENFVKFTRDKNGEFRKIYTNITSVTFCEFHHILGKELTSFRIERSRPLFVQTLLILFLSLLESIVTTKTAMTEISCFIMKTMRHAPSNVMGVRDARFDSHMESAE